MATGVLVVRGALISEEPKPSGPWREWAMYLFGMVLAEVAREAVRVAFEEWRERRSMKRPTQTVDAPPDEKAEEEAGQR